MFSSIIVVLALFDILYDILFFISWGTLPIIINSKYLMGKDNISEYLPTVYPLLVNITDPLL